jgi:hypothetical protein
MKEGEKWNQDINEHKIIVSVILDVDVDISCFVENCGQLLMHALDHAWG